LRRKGRKIIVHIYTRKDFTANYLKNFLSTDPNFDPLLKPGDEPPDAVVIEEGLLSEVERKILKALVEHGSIQKAAAALHYSPSTVKTYLSRIYKRLKVKTAYQAIAFAIKYGFIELD